jgi:GAF domain-containing protein
LEPIPETLEALKELMAVGDTHIAVTLLHMGRAAVDIVPECVGLSLSIYEGHTFTLVATSNETARLDAMQYVDGGPCVEAIDADQVHDVNVEDLLDEGRWQLFALSSRAFGVATSLSLPIRFNDEVMGGVNLYASEPNAFEGKHEQLAQALHAWAPGAVTNADLSFSSRVKATQAPREMREEFVIDKATGFVIARYGLDGPAARERIAEAARRAGVSEADVARDILASGGELSEQE